jgi:hypothetical protein
MIAQRKRTVIRVGPRLAGLPPDEPIPSVVPQPSAVVQAQEVVSSLIEAVAAAQTEGEVKQAVQDTFGPAQPTPPVKRGPGRPRASEKIYATEAERKRVERAATRAKLVLALDAFNVTVDTEITPELQIKYGTTAKTYGQLLKRDPKTLKKIIKLLQQESGVKRSTAGGVMTSAPQGKGKLVTGGYNTAKIDADQGSRSGQQAMLSAPALQNDSELLYGSDSNSALNNTVVLADGSRSTSDRKKSLPVGGSDKQFENATIKETDFTFMSKVRWPQSWFTGKYKPEYREVADECMRQAVNAFRHTETREPGFEPEVGTVETSAQYCVLCDDKLNSQISASEHFLKIHLIHVQNFFRQAGVRFNRKYFGITDTA